MQSFYLSKNQDGYYRVRFSDPNTGKLTVAKSIHTKNKNEATIIACRWLENGIPQSKSCDRVINNKNNNALNLNSIVERLSQDEALRHYCATQIAQRTTLEIAMKILGHKTEDMTRLYAEHETKVKLDNAKDVLEQGWKLLVA